MRSLHFSTERDYKQLRSSRPPFLTEYERDQLAWQRRNRAIMTTGLLLASIAGTVLGVTMTLIAS